MSASENAIFTRVASEKCVLFDVTSENAFFYLENECNFQLNAAINNFASENAVV